jgi:hypothetical protein
MMLPLRLAGVQEALQLQRCVLFFFESREILVRLTVLPVRVDCLCRFVSLQCGGAMNEQSRATALFYYWPVENPQVSKPSSFQPTRTYRPAHCVPTAQEKTALCFTLNVCLFVGRSAPDFDLSVTPLRPNTSAVSPLADRAVSLPVTVSRFYTMYCSRRRRRSLGWASREQRRSQTTQAACYLHVRANVKRACVCLE